jgi:hypothetical protein
MVNGVGDVGSGFSVFVDHYMVLLLIALIFTMH